MKNTLIKILSLVLAVSAFCIFAGCDDESSSKTSESQTESAATSETTVLAADDLETDIKALHYYDTESDDPFAGAWHITEGVGSDLNSFVFLFDGNKTSSIVIGTTGYVESYTVDESEKTFSTQLLFGLNGIYTYEFSNENSKVVLTNTEDNTTTTMEKLVSFDCIPIPDAEPKIDEAILGAWQSDDGDTVYFDKSGIMYENFLGFKYSKYSAENSVITSTYTELEETTEEYEYSISGNTLTFNNCEYSRIPASDLT